ncbi:MAG: hypothetical protein JOY87_00075 [Candidatus Eremiobacteraeota bacterium]|nr:hypothetical protein [Candidatus Eremiobacteraeota bacterium]
MPAHPRDSYKPRSSVRMLAFALVFCGTIMNYGVAKADQASAPVSPSPTASLSPEDAPDFDAPLVPSLWFSLEDEVSPSYDGLSGSSNQINVRGQIPLGAIAQKIPTLLLPHTLQLIKFKVPIVTSAPPGAQKGNGDTTLTFLEYLGSKEAKWVLGPLFKIPTASSADLGSGKWSGGPSGGYVYSHGMTVIGWFASTYFSFAGPKSRANVSQTEFQPQLSFALKNGWILGTSQMNFKYNWENNQWPAVPLGVRIARNYRYTGGQLAAGVEAEKNLAAVDGTPGWTFRLNFKYRFSSH